MLSGGQSQKNSTAIGPTQRRDDDRYVDTDLGAFDELPPTSPVVPDEDISVCEVVDVPTYASTATDVDALDHSYCQTSGESDPVCFQLPSHLQQVIILLSLYKF